MSNEKLTAKKIVKIVVYTSLASVGICLLYLAIFLFSLPFTFNATVSWILSLSVTAVIMVLSFAYTVKKGRKRGN